MDSLQEYNKLIEIVEKKEIIELMPLQEIIAEQIMQLTDIPEDEHTYFGMRASELLKHYSNEEPESYMHIYIATMHKLIHDGQSIAEARFLRIENFYPKNPLIIYQNPSKPTDKIKL